MFYTRKFLKCQMLAIIDFFKQRNYWNLSWGGGHDLGGS